MGDSLDHLAPFDETAACPKCGSQDVNAYYHESTCGSSHRSTCPVYCVGSHLKRECCENEHIDRRCRRCGFAWAEAVLVDLGEKP